MAAAGNFLAVAVVVTITSRAREAVVDRHTSTTPDAAATTTPSKPVSKGRRRFAGWLDRSGVPGANVLGPLAIPTHFTSAMLVAAGTPRSRVLFWQAVAVGAVTRS